MADFYDKASDVEALHRELLIQEVRNRKPAKFSGYCLFCNESISHGRFCCSECHEDWEMSQKYNRIAGKR